MPDRIVAKGHTHVIAVLDMKEFIHDDEKRKEFEYLRGTDVFAHALQTVWGEELSGQSVFRPIPEQGEMSVEEVGFATGVFRSPMLTRHTTTTYSLDKSQVKFPYELETNFQFKTLFKRAWERWDICVRPTVTGFFVIRLTYAYYQTPRSLIDLAKDAIKLQEPLDIPSAVHWLAYNRERYAQQPEKLVEKEQSVRALLAWLGADLEHPEASEQLYHPVQWKIAVEAINLFVNNARLMIPFRDESMRLQPVPVNHPLALHDSYIIYHFDDLLIDSELMDFSKSSKNSAHVKMQATPHTIRKSKKLRNALVNLLEGTVLREPDKPEDELDANGYFPSPRWNRADALIDDPEVNLASWSDELCVFTTRAALMLPSQKWSGYEMAVSTMSSATLNVRYDQYWLAVERMIEFVLEVRVLAQLIEVDSYDLLTEMAHNVEYIRADLFDGVLEISDELKEQMARAAHLRRISALAQSMSHPQYWSRAEFATQKADRLLSLMDVPRIFDHIGHNIDSINVAADHVDELYLTHLSDKNNERAATLSKNLALVSLILAILVLPSFWADWNQVSESGYFLNNNWVYKVYLMIGITVVVLSVIVALFVLIMPAWKGLAKWFRGGLHIR